MVQGVCPADVICVCTASGDIRPLRVQIMDETQKIVRINIEKVISTQTLEHVGAEAVIFRCRATVWEQKWLFELKYMIRTHTWTLVQRFW